MDEISNMSHLDENKNSSTLDNHILENNELPVSPLMSDGKNITPELVFQSPKTPQDNISEVNSNITIQSPKNLNRIPSEMEGGVAKLEIASMHDTSNGSISVETVGSYKSCNGSFLGDANNSFKSLNGSYINENTSPSKSVKTLLDEAIMKIQSPSSQPNASVSIHETESNVSHNISVNSEGHELMVNASLTKNKSDCSDPKVLGVTVELPSPSSHENIQENVGNTDVALNNTSSFISNQSVSFTESNLSNDAPLPDNKNKDDFAKVMNDSSLDGALAAFSALKLEDTSACLSQSNETNLDNSNETQGFPDSSNLMGFTNMIPDTSIADEINCKVQIQVDSPTADDKVNINADSQTFSQLGELSGDVIPETFDGALRDDPFGLKGFDCNTNPADDFVFKVPENPVDAESEEFTDAVQFFKDPSSFQFLESIKTSPPTEGNVPRSSLYIKFDPLHSMFPRNSKSSDVLQALKGETGLEPNVQCLNVSARESLGNILISFDSPRKSGCQDPKTPVLVAPAKVYTEEELQQQLKVNELTNQEMLLKKQREMEDEMARKEQEMKASAEKKDEQIAKLEKLIKVQSVLLKELANVSEDVSDKYKDMLKKTGAMEEENAKFKGEVKTLTEDLQSVETTFADFHKRYEQCKGMLKTFKDNEELLKTKLKELEQAYQELQDGTQEALEKASSEATSIKKTSEAQTAVLKAQLKKAELKISSLESDIKQIKIENSQLGGICDDLMEKVGKS